MTVNVYNTARTMPIFNANAAKRNASIANEILPNGWVSGMDIRPMSVFDALGLMGNHTPVKQKSVMDFTPNELLDKYQMLKAESETWDFTGKSDSEIFGAIKSRFSEVYGADFIDAETLYGVIVNTPFDMQLFQYTIVKYLGGGDFDNEAAVWRKESGYDGMSDDEIRAAVSAKYPENTTLEDVLKKSRELYMLGLEETPLYVSAKDIFARRVKLLDEDFDMMNYDFLLPIWQDMLKQPADYDTLDRTTQTLRENAILGRGEIFRLDDIKGEFAKLFDMLGMGDFERYYDWFELLLNERGK